MPNESMIINAADAVPAVLVQMGKDEFCIAIFHPSTHNLGVSRNLDPVHLQAWIGSFPLLSSAPLQVRIVGGDDSSSARKTYQALVQTLLQIDADRHVLNIVAADVNHKPHPTCFVVNALNGGLASFHSFS